MQGAYAQRAVHFSGRHAYEQNHKNISQNRKVALVLQDKSKAYQLKGKARYFTDGRWLEMARYLVHNKSTGGKYGKPKGAVLIRIEECYNLDTYEKLL